MDLALNNLQRLICHENQATKSIITNPGSEYNICSLCLGLKYGLDYSI